MPDTTEVSELGAISSVSTDDFLYILDTSLGDAGSKKVTVANLFSEAMAALNLDVAILATAGIVYFGDPDTNGSMRLRKSGQLLYQESRLAGAWVPHTIYLQPSGDTTGATDTTNANTASTALTNGGRIMFEAGQYYAQGISLVESIQFMGAGLNATVITSPAGATTSMFVCAVGSSYEGGGIYDMTLDGNSESVNGIDFQLLSRLDEFFIERCKIRNFVVGVWGSADASGNDRFLCINDCLIWGCTTGAKIYEHTRLHNVDFRSNTLGLTGRINDAQFSYCKWAYNTTGVEIASSGPKSSEFNNCIWYNNVTLGIAVQERCVLNSCTFKGDSSETPVGLYIGSSGRCTVTNCNFGTASSPLKGGPLKLENAGGVFNGYTTIVGNVFYVESTAPGIGFGTSTGVRFCNISCNAFEVAAGGTAINMNTSGSSNRNVLSNNLIALTGTGYGMRINVSNAATNGNVITGNMITGTTGDTGLDIDAHYSIVTGNCIQGPATPASINDAPAANSYISGNIGIDDAVNRSSASSSPSATPSTTPSSSPSTSPSSSPSAT